MQLTKRERIILTILVFVSLWASFGYFIILPQFGKSVDYNVQMERLQTEREEMDFYLSVADGLIEIEGPGAERSESYFYENPDDVAADRTLLQVAEYSGLELISMELDAVIPIKNIVSKGDMDAYEVIEEETEPTVSDMMLQAQTVRMTVRGSGECIMTMADRVGHLNKSLVVTGINMIPAATPSDSGTMEGTLTVVYYYLISQ